MIPNIDIEQVSAMDWMSARPSGTIDCIVTDPPYWSLDKWRNVGTTTRLGGGRAGEQDPGKFFQTIDQTELYTCMCEFGRILIKNAHAWIFADGEVMPVILNFAREGDCGFNYAKPFPAIKRTADGLGYKQGMGYHGRCSHEYIVLLEKGRRRFTDENWPDVFQYPWTGATETAQFTPDGKPYPTAKPVALYRRLVELSTQQGETVLDPFAGSGTLAAAARQCHRRAICIDSSDRAIATMTRRMDEYDLCGVGVGQTDLFEDGGHR